MTFTFHINKITLDKNRFSENSQLEFLPGNVTILVGPNNSGKSQILKDIDNYCFTKRDSKTELLSEIQFAIPKEDNEIKELLTAFQKEPPKGKTLGSDEIFLSSPNFRNEDDPIIHTIQMQEYSARIKQGKESGVRPEISSLFTARLDGRARFNLTNPRKIGDLNHPSNFLASMLRKDEQRKRFREITKNEFGLFCYLDTTQGQIQIKMSTDEKGSALERSSSEEAIQFFNNAMQINQLGDGIQAFVGLLLAVSSLEHRILLIDEPEAFLHPPQANHLGGYLSAFARERNGSLIASTHSVDFLLGCLENAPDITIIRLTYDGKIGTIKQLDPKEVTNFIQDSLLRSTNTLNALFHKSAVVSESDGDRVFYSEINRQLLFKKLGIDDPIFLNAHGRTDIHRIVGALRKIGVPTACIYDLDIITLQNNQWKDALKAMNVPDDQIETFDKEREFVLEELKKLKKLDKPDPIKKQGLPALSQSEKNRAYTFLNELKKYGIFVIDLGELEQWLQSLSVSRGDKFKWLKGILDILGTSEYAGIKPAEDVWKFVIEIQKWVSNSDRLGMGT